jgi:electron transport complex protein RnfD
MKSSLTLKRVMWTVIAALIPAVSYSVFLFGLKALVIYSVSVAAAVISEAIFLLLKKKRPDMSDGSAVITGLLIAMISPPDVPLWMIAIGSVFAVIFVKQLFGGLGHNIFNPAIAGMTFMLLSWPAHMSQDLHTLSDKIESLRKISGAADILQQAAGEITASNPLLLLKEAPNLLAEAGIPHSRIYEMIFSRDMFLSLMTGNTGGNIGEVSSLLILIAGLFLIFRKIITWHIPASFTASFAIFMIAYYSLAVVPGSEKIRNFQYIAALYHVLSGGLILGAFFMAADPVTSPLTAKGTIIFGTCCGIIAAVIRIWGGNYEGVFYAILIMNSAVPLIDRLTKPRVFGV